MSNRRAKRQKVSPTGNEAVHPTQELANGRPNECPTDFLNRRSVHRSSSCLDGVGGLSGASLHDHHQHQQHAEDDGDGGGSE